MSETATATAPQTAAATSDAGKGANDTTKAAPAAGTETAKNAFDTPTGDSLLDDAGDPASKPWDLTTGDKPEGLADAFWDPETKTIKVQDVYKKMNEAEERAKGLRSKLSKGLDKAPKNASDYTFKFEGENADALAAYAKGDDPLVGIVKATAHKVGMSQDQFDTFMRELTPAMMQADKEWQESQANPPEMSVEEKNAIKQREYAKIGENAPAIIRSVEAWGRELLANGVLSESEVAAFKDMGKSGDQVRVLNKLRTMMGGGEIIMDTPTDGLPSDQEIGDQLDKAYKSKDAAKIQKAEGLVAQRNQTRSGPMKVR